MPTLAAGPELPRIGRNAAPVGPPVPARRMDDASRRARAAPDRAGRIDRRRDRRGRRIARAGPALRRRPAAVLNDSLFHPLPVFRPPRTHRAAVGLV
ncbi:hypothetical protein EMIT0111MI5_20109 [Burkholderia sp. IT-111MI5]